MSINIRSLCMYDYMYDASCSMYISHRPQDRQINVINNTTCSTHVL